MNQKMTTNLAQTAIAAIALGPTVRSIPAWGNAPGYEGAIPEG